MDCERENDIRGEGKCLYSLERMVGGRRTPSRILLLLHVVQLDCYGSSSYQQ